MLILLVLALVLSLVIVAFIFQNTNPVVVHFLAWQYEGSLAMILFLTFLLGIIISLLIAIPLMIRRKTKVVDTKEKVL